MVDFGFEGVKVLLILEDTICLYGAHRVGD
jgi:hypothetical protein